MTSEQGVLFNEHVMLKQSEMVWDSGERILETADIVEILKKQCATLPGGRDPSGNPIIYLKEEYDGCHDDLRTTLQYLTCLPYDVNSVTKKYMVIIKGRKDADYNMDFISRIWHIMKDQLCRILYVRDVVPEKGDRIAQELKLSKNLCVEVVSVHKLHRMIKLSQLTSEYKGHLSYNHEHWLQNRMFLEQFVKEVNVAKHHFGRMLVRMNDCLKMAISSYQDTLKSVDELYCSLKDMLNSIKKKGMNLIDRLEIDGDSGFKQPSVKLQNLDIREAISLVEDILVHVQKEITNLEMSWETAKNFLDQIEEFHILKSKCSDVMQWITGYGQSLLQTPIVIGPDSHAADAVRREHEHIELQCSESYAHYAELRHTIDMHIQHNHSAAQQLQNVKEKMDDVCSSFARRLEHRRNIVISSSYFHRLIQQVKQRFLNIDEMLNEKWDVDCPQWCEKYLQTIIDVYNKFVDIVNKAANEGQHLIRFLSEDTISIDDNFVGAIAHVNHLLLQLDEFQKQSKENIEIKQLHLQEIRQLYNCIRDAEQAIGWVVELTNFLIKNCTIGVSERACRVLLEEHYKLKDTAKEAYDYGLKLLQMAVILCQLCKLKPEENLQVSYQLHFSWKCFEAEFQDRLWLLTKFKDFFRASDELMEEICDALRATDDSKCFDDRRDAFLHNKLQWLKVMGRSLVQRLQTLEKFGIGDGKRVQNGVYVQHVEKRISEAESMMVELNPRRDSLPSVASTSSSTLMNSFKSAASTFAEDWKTATASVASASITSATDDWGTAASDITSVDDWKSGDEYFSAEESASENGRLRSPVGPEPFELHGPVEGSPMTKVQREIMVSKQSSELCYSTTVKSKQPMTAVVCQNKKVFESQQFASSSSSVRQTVSLSSSEQSLDSSPKPLMTSTPLPSMSPSPPTVSQSETDLLKLTKEVSETMCGMIEAITLK